MIKLNKIIDTLCLWCLVVTRGVTRYIFPAYRPQKLDDWQSFITVTENGYILCTHLGRGISRSSGIRSFTNQ